MGLAASFAIAILIFTITLFIQRPLDFSSFPTILLASLMLRLSLNVSSTKLIIGQGHTGTKAAGHVIEGFAMFIMGGSVFLGLVVFGVLLIVNFIVITKGAGRMAEVGARFALDGMPGKQLAIDSDMAAGAISHAEARERRRIEQEETTFFGSLDGASKFVKGDAVAGLLITLLNLVMGLAMGVLVHGMPLHDAFETYSILTVGDGLVTQIPAVIISIASAMLLSKGGLVGSTDQALMQQLGGYPTALATVAVLMALFAFIPGLPFLPFVIGAGEPRRRGLARPRDQRKAAAQPRRRAAAATPPKKSLGDLLDVDEIHMEFSPNLVPVVMDEATGLDARIAQHAQPHRHRVRPDPPRDPADRQPGPAARHLRDPHPGGRGRRRARSRPTASSCSFPTRTPPRRTGRSVAEPVYGAPARWIAPAQQEEAALMGLSVVTPTEVVATHLLEIVKANFGRLFTRRSLAQAPRRVHLAHRHQARRGEPPDARRVRPRQGADRHAAGGAPPAPRGARLDPQPAADPRGDRRGARPGRERRGALRARPPPPRLPARRRRPGARRGAAADPARPGLGGAVPEPTSSPTASGIVDVALPPAEFNRLAASVAEKIAQAGAQGRYPARRHLDQAAAVPAHGADAPRASATRSSPSRRSAPTRGPRCWGSPDVRRASARSST